jgi:hypothetical protein
MHHGEISCGARFPTARAIDHAPRLPCSAARLPQAVNVQARLTKKGGSTQSGGKTTKGAAPATARKTLRWVACGAGRAHARHAPCSSA